MRIQNLKAPHEAVPEAASPTAGSPPGAAPALVAAGSGNVAPAQAETVGHTALTERQAAEIALLKARVQHLELVVETARSLMASNQERLLRRLHELPRELVELSAQLRRLNPNASC